MKKVIKLFQDKKVEKICCNPKTAHELRQFFHTYRTFWLGKKIEIEHKIVIVHAGDIVMLNDWELLVKYNLKK